MACGTHDLVLSDGTKLTVPQVARQALKEHLWAGFVRKHTDAAGQYTGGISRKDFLCAAKSATKGNQKTFAALDQIKVNSMFCRVSLTFFTCLLVCLWTGALWT